MSPLDAETIRGGLNQCPIGREIVVLEDTPSTNDAILMNTKPATPEGLVIFAEHQTAGRGQRARNWESARGKGLWFSILLRPKIDVSESARLTAWAAENVASTIHDEFSIPATIKPPNDVHIEGRKVAGVLVEMRAQPRAPHLAIAGIGINVNHQRTDFSDELQNSAISVAMILGKQIDRNQFAIALLRNLNRTYKETFG